MKNFNFQAKIATFYRSTLGKRLSRVVEGHLAGILPTLFGYYLLQLGELNAGNWLKSSHILKHIYLHPDAIPQDSAVSVCGKFEYLPFFDDSIDLVFIPHILELSKDPKLILEESYRVLISEGSMVLLAFNPWSLWGLQRAFRFKKSEKFYSMFKVRHWLNELGMEITEEKTFFYRPPINNKLWLRRLRFIEIIGQYCWPFGGGVYLIVAKKKALGMTSLKPVWKKKRYTVVKQLVEPTAHNEQHHETR